MTISSPVIVTTHARTWPGQVFQHKLRQKNLKASLDAS